MENLKGKYGVTGTEVQSNKVWYEGMPISLTQEEHEKIQEKVSEARKGIFIDTFLATMCGCLVPAAVGAAVAGAFGIENNVAIVMSVFSALFGILVFKYCNCDIGSQSVYKAQNDAIKHIVDVRECLKNIPSVLKS